MAEALLLAIDAGQTATKVALFDHAGRQRHAVSAPTLIESSLPHWQELDPPLLWAQVCELARSCLHQARVEGSAVAAVGVCGRGDGVYLVDRSGEPVRPGVLAIDTRATDQAHALASGATGERLLRLPGSGWRCVRRRPRLAHLRRPRPCRRRGRRAQAPHACRALLRSKLDVTACARVAGGGGRSAYWCGLLADALGVPVEVTDATETVSRGAALLAGIAIGAYTGVEEAVGAAVRVARRTSPVRTSRPSSSSTGATRGWSRP